MKVDKVANMEVDMVAEKEERDRDVDHLVHLDVHHNVIKLVGHLGNLHAMPNDGMC